MAATRKRRTYGIAAASLAVHAALLALVAIQAPRLRTPPPVSAPPTPIIPVLIAPRVPPPASDPGGEPTPIRLHRRPQRFNLDELPLAPLLTPQVEAPPEAPTEREPQLLPLPRSRDVIAERARAALRSRRDCDDPALSRAEREACQERFAAGARDAPFPGLGVDRDKARALEAAVRRREADNRYKRGEPGPPVPVPYGGDWDDTRSPPDGRSNLGAGATAKDLGASPLKRSF